MLGGTTSRGWILARPTACSWSCASASATSRSSEGGSAPLPKPPPGIGGAGEAGARSGTFLPEREWELLGQRLDGPLTASLGGPRLLPIAIGQESEGDRGRGSRRPNLTARGT